MDEEKNDMEQPKVDDLSLPEAVEVDKIIDFYKDKISETEDVTDDTPKEPSKSEHFLYEFANKLPFFKKFLKKDDKSGIQEKSFGMTEKARLLLYRLMSAAISLVIIIVSIILAIFMPGNQATIDKKCEELRQEKAYVSLKSRYNTLADEVEELKSSNERKKNQLDSITDIDNTKATLRTEIKAKADELNVLNEQIAAKRQQIAELDESIKSKAGPETVLSPGKYVIGKNLAAGKYSVTGSGKFMVASKSGKSKIKTTLGSTPLEVTLEEGDIVKIDNKVKFVTYF